MRKGITQVFCDDIVESFTIQTLARYKILDQGREIFLQSQIRNGIVECLSEWKTHTLSSLHRRTIHGYVYSIGLGGSEKVGSFLTAKIEQLRFYFLIL